MWKRKNIDDDKSDVVCWSLRRHPWPSAYFFLKSLGEGVGAQDLVLCDESRQNTTSKFLSSRVFGFGKAVGINKNAITPVRVETGRCRRTRSFALRGESGIGRMTFAGNQTGSAR